MTNIFSLVKESSIPDEIFSSKYSKEIYTESSISLFESFNEILTEKTKALYTKIAEADDVRHENDSIKNFISEIQAELNKLSLKLSSTSSRFAIALSNYCDTAKQMVDNNIGIDSNIHFTGKYMTYDTQKLLDSNTPRMNPYSIFEKEFNLIAQLMQELPVTASNKEKLDAIASVCDKFNGFMSESIRRDVYVDLIQQGEEGPNPLSSSIITLFRNKEIEERNITIEDYQDAISCISNCDQYISSITAMNTKLINDLYNIISDLGVIVSGCDRNKFKVDTKQDGIKNTIYSVDVYGSNKIMWLVQEKVRQICDVYDKYFIALSVKMDCILSYVKQSSDIIEAFNYINAKCSNNTPRTGIPSDISNDDNDNSDEPVAQPGEDEVSFDDTEPDGSESMDTTGKELTEDEEESGTDDSSDIDLGDTSTEETDDFNEEPVPNFESANYGEFYDDLLNFYVDLHECSAGFQQIEILEHVSLMLEEDDGDDSKKVSLSGKDISNLGHVSYSEKKRSLWRRILDKFSEIWNKFKNIFRKTYQEKVDFLKENESFIKCGFTFDYPITMSVIRHERIDDIKIPNFDLSDYKVSGTGDDIKVKFSTAEEFIEKTPEISKFVPKKGDSETISTKVKNYIIDPEETINNANKIDPVKIYDEYCKGFMDRYSDIKTMVEGLNKAQKEARNISTGLSDGIKADAKSKLKNESGTVTADMYFTEITFGNGEKKDNPSSEDNDALKASNDIDKSMKKYSDGLEKGLKAYFEVSTSIASSKMFVIQKVFDEYNAFLKWYISKSKDEADKKGSEIKKAADEKVKSKGSESKENNEDTDLS